MALAAAYILLKSKPPSTIPCMLLFAFLVHCGRNLSLPDMCNSMKNNTTLHAQSDNFFFEQGGTKCLYFLLLLDDEVTLR